MVAGLLYAPMHWIECVVASFADAVMVVTIVSIGAAYFKSWFWTDNPEFAGYALIAVAGTTMSFIGEFVGISLLGLWSYRPEMPLLFGIGVVPVLQMTILPCLIFASARWIDARQRGRERKEQQAHLSPTGRSSRSGKH